MTGSASRSERLRRAERAVWGGTVADLQLAVLDGLGVGTVDVVGHSIGALFGIADSLGTRALWERVCGRCPGAS